MFHVMTKPIGAICNLDCSYCFYLEKEKLYPGKNGAAAFRMTDAVLEKYVEDYIAAQDGPEINFAWQGGEPTLMGVGFFEKAVALQKKFCPPGKKVGNAFQTNGVLLDDAWCEFFKRESFLIGLSIDGPRELHDKYRVTRSGEGSFDAVVRGMKFLKKHGVDFNTLTVVNREVSQRPLDVYRFLKEQGSGFMQFIPLVERAGGEDCGSHDEARPRGPRRHEEALAGPPVGTMWDGKVTGGERGEGKGEKVTSWSVESAQWGAFLCAIFDEWLKRDVGKVFVQMFDVQLGIAMGMGSSLCVFAPTCGKGLAIEHNGDLYACDHYVYPEYKLGNIMEEGMAKLADSAGQRKFGLDKQDTLPKYCRECEVKTNCQGECPKHRFIKTPEGEAGLNYLCAGYRRFFNHIRPAMETMTALLRAGRPAADVMRLGRAGGDPRAVGRNDACPCGSGRKF